MGITLDFFGVVGSVFNVFLVLGIAVALGLAAWITFLRGGPDDKLPSYLGWLPRLFDAVPRFFDRLSGSIGQRTIRPARTQREKRRNQRPGRKAAGAKQKRPSE